MSGHGPASPMSARKSPALKGIARVPGDKSISHRSLILGALAVGETRITGLLEGQDVLDTAGEMRAFGADVIRHGEGEWSVHGVGVGGFAEPDNVIDCGNSGTGVRLIMGAMATTGITAIFTGDASLRSRPMGRITDPLALFGAQCVGRGGGRLPLTIVGANDPVPVRYVTPMLSAQVKSAVLLAGLNAPGETVVIEKEATRDHTERMLAGFGARISSEATAEGLVITLVGQPELTPQILSVPRDPSSAAEPVADIRARFSPLKGIEVPPDRAASMIDEYPILAAVAATAEGRTIMRGVKELRVKESDRIDAMARGLEACGVSVEEDEDTLIVHGLGAGGVPGGATCATHLDHRIAMSFLCLGLSTRKPVRIDDAGPITTSFPDFVSLMTDLGAQLSRDNT